MVLISRLSGVAYPPRALAVFFDKKGEVRKHYREGREDQLGALGLVVNAVAL